MANFRDKNRFFAVVNTLFLKRGKYDTSDNLLRFEKGGALTLRDELNSYGFITKKALNNKLNDIIQTNPNKLFLISKRCGRLVNKYNIFERVIQPGLEELKRFNNV